jgi:hypothetical protein
MGAALGEHTEAIETFALARGAFRLHAPDCRAAFFWFSVPNLVPKLALGKVALVAQDGAVVLEDAAGARVLPVSDRPTYYNDLLTASARHRTLLLVPETLAQHMGKVTRFSAQRQQTEWLIPTATSRDLPGPRLSTNRRLCRKAERSCVVEPFDPKRVDEYLEVCSAWYRAAQDRYFRTYDKTSMDWLLRNWVSLLDLFPDMRCLGVRNRETGRLEAFNVASSFVAGEWSAYTRRYRPDAPDGVTVLVDSAMAALFPEPVQNNGTADTPGLRAWKALYGTPSRHAWKVTR